MDHDLIGSEYSLPPEEYKLPPEDRSMPDNEFSGYQAPTRAEEKDRHSIVKRLVLMPIAASISAAALFFSALGSDPLGNDFLVSGLVSANSETPVAASAPRGTEAPTAVPTEKPTDDWNDTFPILPNLDPDTAGEYAWSGQGSEEYVRLVLPGDNDYTYLEIGTVWERFGYTLGSAPGASYDLASNTLTLENFTCDILDVNLMGNGFKLKLIGTNRIGNIVIWGAMYGGSLTITGNGTLYVNENGTGIGICLNAELSQSCLMIDREATVEVWGDQAIYISETSMAEAVQCLKPIETIGGEGGILSRGTDDGNSIFDYSILDNNGAPAAYVRFAPRT
ncbi:MAG: hypothetical protein IKZ82_05735 [Clostridia bacterium]|nr:hypothetical protein [Clostridia bacterium]MBR5948132.1 hypothetical protein [Clostridia bacterium]